MLSGTLENVTAEVSLLALVLSDLLGSEILFSHATLPICSPCFLRSPEQAEKQNSKDFYSLLVREKKWCQLQYNAWTQKPELAGKEADSTPDTCKAGSRKAPAAFVLAVVTELQTWMLPLF